MINQNEKHQYKSQEENQQMYSSRHTLIQVKHVKQQEDKNFAESSEYSGRTLLQQQQAQPQNVNTENKKNLREILVQKKQILQEKQGLTKEDSSAYFLQSLMMKKAYQKVKVEYLVKQFTKKMLSNLQIPKFKKFDKSKRMRTILFDKSDAVVLTRSDEQLKILKRQPIESQNNHSIYLFIQNKISYLANQYKQKFYSYIKNIAAFDQLSTYMIIWDTIQLISLTFFFIMIPLCICFYFYNNIYLFYTAVIFFLILFADIFVKLNTTRFFKGKLINNRAEIIQNYKQNGMKKDCLTLIPLILLIFYQFSSMDIDFSYENFIVVIIYFLFYFRLAQFQQFQQKLEIIFDLSPKMSQIMNMWNLLFLNIYIIHFLACAWIQLSNLESNYGIETTWLDQQNVDSQNNISKYIYSFYFNTVTIVTVGYGDIFPQTLTEKIMSIICVLSGCGVFAYSISEIGQIFQDIQKIQKLRKNNIYIINKYLKQKRISNQLQHKIRNYLEYYWSENEFTSVKQEQRIINQLSNNLRENLLIEANKIFILESPILRQNFSQQTLLKTIAIAQEQKYTPEENIFLKNEMEFSIYFIERGSVEVYIEGFSNFQQKQSKCTQMILNQGQFFGEGSFFTGRPRKQTFRSLEFTTLIKIDREGFLKILKENQEDYEKFCNIKDQIIINGSTQYSRTCTICKSTENTFHSEDSCPFIHFSPNLNKLQNQFMYQVVISDRLEFPRRKYKLKSSLIQLREIQTDQMKFINENNSFINHNYNNSQYNLLSNSKSNLSISCKEDQDDILSSKQENINQSENSINPNSPQISSNIKKVNTFSLPSNQIEQNLQFQIQSHSADKKKQQDQNKKIPIQQNNCVVSKKLIQTNDTQLLYQMYFASQFNSMNSQQQAINQQPQKDKIEDLDSNKLNILQGINFQSTLDQDDSQKKLQKYLKKSTSSYNRNSMLDINYQNQDDFNIHLNKKTFSKLSVQYDDANNNTAISHAYNQYRNYLNGFIQLDDFDKMNIFEIYFTHNNYDLVLAQVLKKKASQSAKIKKLKSPLEKQKSQDLAFFNQTNRNQKKRFSSSKIKPQQPKLNIDCSYKILLNGTGNHDKQIQNQNEQILNQQKSVSNNNTSSQENDEDRSPQILAPSRINILPRQSIRNRQSFFNRQTSAQSTKLKHSLSYQMYDKQEQASSKMNE
ncbi:hypothetical protein ABPG73_000178 [Tetrahymena malaccensis]